MSSGVEQHGALSAGQQLLAGKYRLLSRFAEGGMGELWLAEHRELETTVVIKRIHDWGKDAQALERFRREAKMTANLRSRHVVRVFDFGVEDSGPYLAMERLHGEDVAEMLELEGRLPLEVIDLVLDHTAKALQAAHACGLVHRDIKPSNLFLTREEGERVVKVLDFGIAKELAPATDASTLTRTGALVGSPGYMSPEQVRGQQVDSRSDLWSLGAVLFELMTEQKPFLSEHLGDTLARVCAGEYDSARLVACGFGAEWVSFFDTALSVDPADRFQSVDELVHEYFVLRGKGDARTTPSSAETRDGTRDSPSASTERRPSAKAWLVGLLTFLGLCGVAAWLFARASTAVSPQQADLSPSSATAKGSPTRQASNAAQLVLPKSSLQAVATTPQAPQASMTAPERIPRSKQTTDTPQRSQEYAAPTERMGQSQRSARLPSREPESIEPPPHGPSTSSKGGLPPHTDTQDETGGRPGRSPWGDPVGPATTTPATPKTDPFSGLPVHE